MPGTGKSGLALAGLVLGLMAFANSASAPVLAGEGRVVVPNPAKGMTGQCVADTAFMRRNHMILLKHKRDRTVHEGVRTKQFSLAGCVTCHAVAGPDARPITVKNPKHFCRQCHDYAAVKIDCFECHASRPDTKKSASVARPGVYREVLALKAFLKTIKQ